MIPHEYYVKVKNFFLGDAEKTWKWYFANNPALGGISPIEMIKCGRVEKLKKFIDSSLGGNKP